LESEVEGLEKGEVVMETVGLVSQVLAEPGFSADSP
jgi:hypothetical protein